MSSVSSGGLTVGRGGALAPTSLASAAALPFQPLAQVVGGQAVVAVIGLDLLQQRLAIGSFLGFEPVLELHDALARVAQIDFALEPVERLQPFDGVALHRGPDALPHHPIQVHEDPPAQELVHLRLAGGVAPGQPLHGRGLVGRVVIDVHARVRRPAIHDEVDAVLERLPLGRRRHRAVGDRPERVKRRVARGVRQSRLDEAEEIVDAVNLVGSEERIAL